MANRAGRAAFRRIDQIFKGRSVAGLGEDQLLDRYVSRRDEAAFEAILQRHGPMVRGVCRRVLGDRAEADDAFQAVFLVLVRKAAGIRQRHLLGPWLHAVALKTARRARAISARAAGAAETPEPADRTPSPAHAVEGHEVRLLIDEEVERLPRNYRLPIILCYFEGKTHDQAAEALGWPVGTVRGRLARARDRLRERLIRRGLAPAAGLSAAMVAEAARGASVPLPLIALTLRLASPLATGPALAAGVGVGSALAYTLGRDIARTMLMTRLGLFAACTLSAAGLGLAAGGAIYATQGPGRFPGAGFPDGPLTVAVQHEPRAVPAPAAPDSRPPLPDGGPPPLPPDPGPGPDDSPPPLEPDELPPPDMPSERDRGPAAAPPPTPTLTEGPDVPGEFEPPPPPDGQAWSQTSVFDPQTGRMRTAYALVSVPSSMKPHQEPPTPTPIPSSAQPPVFPDVPPAPIPTGPATIPPIEPQPAPMPLPASSDIAEGDYSAYLARTRKEVEAAVSQLAREEGQLDERLRRTQENLRRLARLQQVLEAEESGPTPAPRVSRRPAQDMPQELYPADRPGPEPDFFDEPNLVVPTEIPAPNPVDPLEAAPQLSTSPDDRLQSLESKLERLLESVDGLRRELEALKERREPEIPADLPRPSSS